MKKSVWILIVIFLLMGGFDAARPYLRSDHFFSSDYSNMEKIEFFGFIIFVVAVGITLFFWKLRSKK